MLVLRFGSNYSRGDVEENSVGFVAISDRFFTQSDYILGDHLTVCTHEIRAKKHGVNLFFFFCLFL